MAQFDVHRNLGMHRRAIPFVVVVQSRRLDSYGRRLVAPLVRAGEVKVTEPTLNPSFKIKGQKVILHPLDIVSVAKDKLGPHVGSLRSEGDRIIEAIEVVISRAWG